MTNPRPLSPRENKSPRSIAGRLRPYRYDSSIVPMFVVGDALNVLWALPPAFFDCTITSPPYWGKRQYSGGGIGVEADFQQYIAHREMVQERDAKQRVIIESV